MRWPLGLIHHVVRRARVAVFVELPKGGELMRGAIASVGNLNMTNAILGEHLVETCPGCCVPGLRAKPKHKWIVVEVTNTDARTIAGAQ